MIVIGVMLAICAGGPTVTTTAPLLCGVPNASPARLMVYRYQRDADVLVFDPALNLNSDPVCAGEPARFRPGTPGRFYVYAIYCRNDRTMSQTTAWTDATGPTDPRIESLFRQLFPVVFSEQQSRWAFNDPSLR